MKKIETKQQKKILKVAVVTSFITTFMGSALNLSIPDLEEQFQVSGALIGWVVTAYTLAVAASCVPIGKIADVKGRRTIFLLGIGAFGITSVLCSFASNIWMMLLFRIMQGIASAMIFATNNAILINAYPAQERGRVIGVSTAAVYVGLSLGPVAGGILNGLFGFQSIFIVSALVALVAFILTARGVEKDNATIEDGHFDFAGNLFYVLFITATLYGLTNFTISNHGWIILAAGILFGLVFVEVEKRAGNPVIKVTMFSKDPAFTLSNLAALLNYGATFAISYLISIYLQVVLGYTSQVAGLILIAQPVMQAAFSPMMGKLSDKIAPYKLASLGMTICALGLVIFSMLNEATHIGTIVGTLMISGFGFALFSSPNTNAILSCVDKSEYSVANSILSTMRTYGHTSSMAVVTIVVGMNLGTTPLNEAEPQILIETMHRCFIVFIILCVIGVFMSMKRRKQ